MAKQVKQIPIPEESPSTHRLSWWFENTLVRVVKRLINSVSMQVRQIFSFGITDFVEDFENELIPLVKPLIQEILLTPDLPAYIKEPLEQALMGTSQAGAAILAGVGGAAVGSASQGLLGPISNVITQEMDKLIKSHLVDIGNAIVMFQRGIITADTYRSIMARSGVNESERVAYTKLGTPLMDDTTLTQLMWRDEISDFALSVELKKRGMTETQVGRWKSIRKLIPSPNALISIAVREGFNDDVAARFGYDEDYPTVAADWAEKQGMSQEFFKASWRAHWTLPGLVQVREMYHRDIINIDDVRVYLKAADLPIFWRKAIIKWMDRVVTRVDARRMYDLGIWNEKRVFEHHKELGYNDDDAGDMTMWVALNYMSDDRDLTKSDVLTMYQDGILNELEATSYLTALDYKPSAIALMIAHRDLKRDEAYERQIISNVKALFIGGLYDRTDVFAKLGKIATPDAVIKQNLAVWDLEKERKVAVPSTTQLRDMVLENVITVNTFITEMRNKKYPDKYINWYVALWLGE